MPRYPLNRPILRTSERLLVKFAVVGLAALGGMVECAALWRARLSSQITTLRQS